MQTILLVSAILLFSWLIIAYVILPHYRKAQIEQMVNNLRRDVTLENFQDRFNRKFHRRQLSKTILDAIYSDVVDPLDLELDPHTAKDLCKQHLLRIVAVYEHSFTTEYWKTYEQTKKGYRAFISLAWINQLNHPNQYEMIKALFCGKLYILATGENVFLLDNGAVQEKVAKECGFTPEEIERWCLNPKKNIVATSKEPVSA